MDNSVGNDVFSKSVTERKRQFLSLWLGSLKAAVSISRGEGLTVEAMNWLGEGEETNVAHMLKMASIFYCSGEIRKTEKILENLDVRYQSYTLPSMCSCYFGEIKFNMEFAHQVYAAGESERACRFPDCVKFSPQERHCAPPALRHEFDRAMGDDKKNRDPEKDGWMDLAVVDSLTFLCFLQYLICGKAGKLDKRRFLLQQLVHVLRNIENLKHRETGWNLLGQCLEEEKQPETAMHCYRTSLEIRPRNNAANWHIQNLRNKVSKRGEPIE